MNLSFFLETFRLGVTNLHLHKLRSFLTTSGILIGVGAVIAMLAIGEGAKRKAVAEVEQLGATNIIIRSVPPPEATQSTARRQFVLNYGLKRADLDLVRQQTTDATIPAIEMIVPCRDAGKEISRSENKSPNAAAVATNPDFLRVANLTLNSGRFLVDEDTKNARTVCVLGDSVARQLFGAQDPMNLDQAQRRITIGNFLFEVVGTLKPVGLAGGKGSALTGRDLNFDVYFPLSTNAACFSDMIFKRSSGSVERKIIELTEIYVRCATAGDVEPTAAALQRLMDIRHADASDVRIVVPRELLNQANRTATIFGIVMGSIAFLSLFIGGIGIMNISLATVTERTREIGVRRALGGKRSHIITQFLVETTALSLVGGLFGVAFGPALSFLIEFIAPDDFPTAITLWSVALSFTTAAIVGILSGLYPAIVAAHKDPIEALRHD